MLPVVIRDKSVRLNRKGIKIFTPASIIQTSVALRLREDTVTTKLSVPRPKSVPKRQAQAQVKELAKVFVVTACIAPLILLRNLKEPLAAQLVEEFLPFAVPRVRLSSTDVVSAVLGAALVLSPHLPPKVNHKYLGCRRCQENPIRFKAKLKQLRPGADLITSHLFHSFKPS